jgi:hypothetical protein
MSTDTRIESLERQVRKLRRYQGLQGILFVVIGCVVGYFVATNLQSVPDVMQAKKFEVVNDAGKKVAELTSTAGGSGALSIGDNDGVKLALLAVYPDGAALGLLNKDGGEVPLAMFAATRYGGTMYITNKDEQVVGALSVIQNGDGVLKTSNAKGRVTFESP